MTHKLKVTFAGIGTHFRDVVPGVPHRAVLPNATALRTGYLHLPWSGVTFPYYLLPHYPMLLTPRGVRRPTVPGIIDDGFIYAGAQLRVLNALGEGVSHPSFDATYSITSFVPQYNYSPEVVLGGRASCYFDVLSGDVQTRIVGDKARQVVIHIHTDGPPRLLVTPFRTRATRSKTTVRTLQSANDDGFYELTVANMEVHAVKDVFGVDFLLNYLTANGGIPDVVTSALPGMPEDVSQRASHESIGKGLEGLPEILLRGRPSSEQMDHLRPDELGPSCSDSRYP